MKRQDRETNMSDIDDKKDAIIQTRSLLLELIAFHSFKSLFPFSPFFFFLFITVFYFLQTRECIDNELYTKQDLRTVQARLQERGRRRVAYLMSYTDSIS